MLTRNRHLVLVSTLALTFVGSCVTFSVLLAGSTKSRYRVNSKTFRSDPKFRRVLHGSTVSFDSSGMTVKRALREIARQSEVDVAFHHAFDRGSDRRLSISFEDAPFWVAVAEVCKAGGWPCSITTEPAVRVSEEGDTPIDGYQAKGPFFLLWSVLNDGSIQCRLLCDPVSQSRVFHPRVDPTFKVILSNGRRISVKPEHEMQDGMSGRIWSWSSNSAFGRAAKARRVEVTLEVTGIVDPDEFHVPWRSNQRRRAGKNELHVESVRKETVEDWDPDRWGEKSKYHEFTATITLSNDSTKKYDRIMAANRQPTPEEWNEIRVSQGREEFGIQRAWVVGTSGEQLKTALRRTGTSGRYRSMRLDVSGRTLKGNFEPHELFILSGGTREVFNVTFTVEDVPLVR